MGLRRPGRLRASTEPAAPRWEASLLNNLGMAELLATGETDPYVDEELQLLAGEDPAS